MRHVAYAHEFADLNQAFVSRGNAIDSLNNVISFSEIWMNRARPVLLTRARGIDSLNRASKPPRGKIWRTANDFIIHTLVVVHCQ